MQTATKLMAAALFLSLASMPEGLKGQDGSRLFPDRALLPTLLAGPRDPKTSAGLLYVTDNPNQHGAGVEAEVSLGMTLPVLILSGTSTRNPVVIGIEGVAFARFGLQVLERELIASDWAFAVPVVWHRDGGWIRFRYYHTSSHMGDEYTRRFEDPGLNYSRDAAEILSFHTLSPRLGVYGGARFSYNVHPEESERWIVRFGGQMQGEEGGSLLPFLATDFEWDQDAGGTRMDIQAGFWLPKVGGRRAVRISAGFLTGPSPLGQFSSRTASQIGLTLQGSL